jgi:hypothetical protein
MVGALLQSPTYHSQLESLAAAVGLRGQKLRTCTLSGKTLATAKPHVMLSLPRLSPVSSRTTKTLPAEKPPSPPAIAVETLAPPPTFGEKPPPWEELTWEEGIDFTPRNPGPLFTFDDAAYNLGSLHLTGAEFSSFINLTRCYRLDAVPICSDLTVEPWGRTIGVLTDLPEEPATYLFAIRLTSRSDQSASYLANHTVLRVFDEQGERELDFTPLTDGSGLVTLVDLVPLTTEHRNRYQDPDHYGMRRISAQFVISLDATRGMMFRGIKLTRL